VNRSWVRRSIVTAAAASLAVTLLGPSTAVHAAQPDVIAASGSDATSRVMTAIFAATGNPNVYNVPAQLLLTGDYKVPGDAFCNDVTYNATGTGTDSNGNPKIVSPLGAGQGQSALDGSVLKTYPGASFFTTPNNITAAQGGCIDIARLTTPYSTTSAGALASGAESYAFALDAVGWSSPSLNAPAYLTLQDLRDIWNCNLNDWGQVGGTPGPIVRVLPPYGGGTRRYFLNQVLKITSETASTPWVNPPVSGTIPAGHPGAGTAITCPPVVEGPEQSNGNALLSPSTRTDNQKYISFYSAGNWVQQANNASNPTIDIRGGDRPGGLIGIVPTGSTGTFPPAYTVRWTGTAWSQNDGTILGSNESGARSIANVTAAAQFSTSLTAAAGTFTNADIGFNVQGSFINDGTVITAVSADGTTATITPGAKSGATGSITVGWAIVSEKNPDVPGTVTASKDQYPGVRMLYNAIRPDEPDYLAARALIGYDDTQANGARSALCDGSDEGILDDYGFVALRAIDPTGPGTGNDQLVTCRKQ